MEKKKEKKEKRGYSQSEVYTSLIGYLSLPAR